MTSASSKIPADTLHIEPTPMGWIAYYDPEGFTGHGKTQQDAITDLLEQTDEAYSVMWAERQRLRKELADMRDNGLRFDLNPTLDHHPERVAFSYLAYIRRIDESIRERAKRVLEDAPSGRDRVRCYDGSECVTGTCTEPCKHVPGAVERIRAAMRASGEPDKERL